MRWGLGWAVVFVAGCAFDSTSAGTGGSGQDPTAPTSTTDSVPDPTAPATGMMSSATTSDPSTTTASSTTPEATTSGPSNGSSDSTAGSTGEVPEPFTVGPFGEPELAPGINSSQEDDDPTLRSDLREIYFASDRGSSESIYVATRPDKESDWGGVMRVNTLSSGQGDTTPQLSPDGLTMIVSSLRDDLGHYELYFSTRADVDTLAWEALQPMTPLNSTDSEFGGTFTADTLTIYFSRAPSMGDADIFRATRPDPTSAFEDVEALTSINTGFTEMNPWASPDGTVLVLETTPLRGGARDLSWTELVDGEFTPPTTIDELNTAVGEVDPWLAPDGSIIYFARWNEAGQGLDIFFAERQPL